MIAYEQASERKREKLIWEIPAENHQIVMYDKSCFDHKFIGPFFMASLSTFTVFFLTLSLFPATHTYAVF